MKERPILFSSEMVRAILEGRKTQTRRVIKPQPVEVAQGIFKFGDGCEAFYEDGMKEHLFHDVYGSNGTPYGSVYGDGTADRLWVRETWATHPTANKLKPSDELLIGSRIYYRATAQNESHYMWRPSIFMPRWASRITLELTDVRVQRLQEISEYDQFYEGLVETKYPTFAGLWDSINAKRGYSWESDPFVWALTFKVVTE